MTAAVATERDDGNGELEADPRPFSAGDSTVPPSSAQPDGARRVPVWAVGVGSLVAVLISFGLGYAVNAGDADRVRDDLNAELDRSDEEIEGLERTRAAAEAGLDRCRDAVEGIAALEAAADDLTDDWQKAQSLMIQWLGTAEGSAEEAAIDAELTEIEARMSGRFGALSASVDRVTADSESCAAT